MSPAIPFREAVSVWTRVGLQSFGGPAGQIAVMHRILVEERRWISEQRFLHALNFCMLLPGPEAMQLATYLGWLMHGTRGGLVAGLLFVLPGVVALLALSVIYVSFGEVAFVSGIFAGLQPAILAIVVAAVWKIGQRALHGVTAVVLAAAAFIALFFFAVPFPLVVAGAAVVGLVAGTRAGAFPAAGAAHAPGAGAKATVAATVEAPQEPALLDQALAAGTPPHLQASLPRALRVVAIWGLLWLAPVLALHLTLGPDHVFTSIAVLFSVAAVVTFGGAYAVLAWVAQRAVELHGWLSPAEMLDGLGLAESTPGPLIMVVQFVGFLAGARAGGGEASLLAGTWGGLLATWVTFAPCFLWIFLAGPWIEALRGRRGPAAALAAITAAVVGVILNLALWFALHVIFAEVSESRFGPLRVLLPELESVRWTALALTIAAALMTFVLRWGMLVTLGVCAAAGALLRLAGA